MGTAYNPKLVTSGLVLCLDAGNPKNAPLTSVEYLIVGGGGGAGAHNTGGGGGGGVLQGKSEVSSQAYDIVVGNGGSAGNFSTFPTNGGNSTAFGLTAIGGGRPGAWTQYPPLSGGSGGGGGAFTSATAEAIGASGTAGQGNSGGDGVPDPNRAGGGGGGAGSPGGNASSNVGGKGGDGLPSSISGTLTYYGGGGSGASRSGSEVTDGGLGGGGKGFGLTATKTGEQNGTPNTGGGGGGAESGSQTGTTGGSGGSGIVIIRYPGPQRATGGTVTTVGNDIVHTFTGNGTFTVLPAYTNSQAFNWVTDLSGNNNHGTPVNGPTFSTSNGGSFVFDGSNDYVIIPHNSALNPTLSMSLSAWINITSFVGSMSICGKGTNISGQGGYDFRIDTNNQLNLVKYFIIDQRITLSTSLTTNTWYNIAAVQSSTQVDYYINGSNVGFFSNSSEYQTNTSEFRIARARADTYTPATISIISFYNRALTAAEIQQNFQATRGRYGI
jgi:hypothetical protein